MASASPRKSSAKELRLAVWQSLQRVFDGLSLSREWPQLQASLPADSLAQAQAWLYTALRFAPRNQWLLSRYLDKPLRRKDRDIEALMLLGLSQLQAQQAPDAVLVDETVAAVPRKKSWAKGLVNGVLRRYLREAEALQQEQNPVWRWAHPSWFVARAFRYWPQQAEELLLANNQQAPLSLRVNPQHGSRDTWIERWQQQGLSARPHALVSSACELEQAGDVTRIPGYREGAWAVQDAAAQLAAHLLSPEPGQRVLDACAAPGGKTAHLAEFVQSAERLWALDVDAERLDRVSDNLKRLGHQATVVCGDAAKPEDWWDGQPFDRVLLDAPCSATGVIRRHPDIKWHRQPEDVDALVELQAELLQAIWPTLAPGGMLLYATCSIWPEENEQQIARFLKAQPDAHEKPIDADWGLQRMVGRQILPGMHGMDGFYYACLCKSET